MEKENNKNNKKALCNIITIAAILCYLAAIVIILKGDRSNGVVWVCIGTAMISSSTILRSQGTKQENATSSEDAEELKEE